METYLMLILILWSAFCFLFCFSYPSGIRVLYKTEFILPLFIYRGIFYSTSCRYIASWFFSFSGKGGRKGRLAKTTPLRFANFYLSSRGEGVCCFFNNNNLIDLIRQNAAMSVACSLHVSTNFTSRQTTKRIQKI